MNPGPVVRRRTPDRGGQPRVFTLESANRALVLVRKIVEDIVDCYRELISLRGEREELAGEVANETRNNALRTHIEHLVRKLNTLSDELSEIGVELKDWATGLVDFPALHEGQKVLLCWRLGEPQVEYWHEPEAGFAGRKPIDSSF